MNSTPVNPVKNKKRLGPYLAFMLLISVFSVSLEAIPPASFFMGYTSGGKEMAGDFIGPQTEYTGLIEAFNYKDWYIETGVTFWNDQRKIAGHDYGLDSLIIPVQVSNRKNITATIRRIIGASTGPHLIIENLEHTERYFGFNNTFFIGVEKENPTNLDRIRFEVGLSQSSFKYLDTLNLNAMYYRLGVTKKF